MYSFKDKVVWVTGSSSGIGVAIALGFAKHGASVVVHGNTKKQEAENVLDQAQSLGSKGLLVIGYDGDTYENRGFRCKRRSKHLYKRVGQRAGRV